MMRSVWFALLLSVSLTTLLLAKPGVVKTRDGQSFEGEIEEKPEEVTINAKGIVTRFSRDRVASIDYAPNYERQFAEKLAKLGPKDFNGRMALARDAFNNRKYTLARDVVEQALTIDPNSADAVQLRETISSQIRLERTRPGGGGAAATPEPTRPGEPAPAATTKESDQRYLKPADINAIRQKELRPTDPNIRIRFDRNVQRRFAQFDNHPLAEFTALTPMQQAQAILDHGPKEMKHDVQILTDPPALAGFRRIVQPFVQSSCATAGCHVGNTGGSFVLFNNDFEPATYSNFYIMSKYSKPATGGGSIFAGGDMKMVDRTRPSKSLLLQYSIPMDISEYDHPPVQGYRPMLKGMDDPKYKAIVQWIAEALNPVDQDYGVEYKPPTAPPKATQPATKPGR